MTVTSSASPTVTQAQTTATSTATAPLTTRTTTASSQTAADASAGTLQVLIGPFASHHGGHVRVRVSCSRRCAGRVALRVDGQVIGRARIVLRQKDLTGVATLTLSDRGRRVLGHGGRLHAVVVLTLNGRVIRQQVLVG